MLLLRQFLMEWKLYSRDRVALFWAFAFPMLMLLGFGTIFRSGSGPSVALVVTQDAAAAPGGRDLLAALAKTPVKVAELPAGEAEARWRKGETSAQLDRAGDGFALRVNSYLAAQGQVAAQLVQEASLEAQLHREGQEPRLLPVRVESPGHAHAANYAAFLLPGLLGMNLMSMGLFGVGMVNVSYREKGKFRRLAVTPLPKWIFLLGQVLHRLTVTLLQSALMLVLGQFAFGIANQGSYVLLTLVMALGTACFMAMGFALASFADTTEGYAGISNAFFFPMMFLSGVYFTLDGAPRWMQQAVVVLPLSPYLKALRAVFNDGANLDGHWAGLAVVAAWTLCCFLVAVKKFKWA
ncbi:MAG: ABC transporter permease [Holophaga sp.]|jgi:ABC-type multidrug transport system permease subunit